MVILIEGEIIMKMEKDLVFISFAVFGAVLMLSAAFVQPVSAKASGQADVLQKYDSYLNKIGKFGKKISSDEKLNSLFNKLAKNRALNKIIKQAKSAKTKDEIMVLTEKFENILTKQKEYKQIVKIFNTRYGKDLTVLKSFVKKLENKPDDVEVLLKAFTKKSITLITYNDEPEAITFPLRSTSGISGPQLGSKSTVVSDSLRYSSKGSQIKTSTSTKAGGSHGGASAGYESSRAVLKQDLNGNIYVYVPGQGWVNPACLGPGGWWLFFLWSLFTHNWILFSICISLAAWHYNRGHELRANWWGFWALVWWFRIQDIVLP